MSFKHREDWFECFSRNLHVVGIAGLGIPFFLLTIGVLLDMFEYALVLFFLFLPLTCAIFCSLGYLLFKAMVQGEGKMNGKLLLGFATSLLGVLFYLWLILPDIEYFT